MKKFILIMCLLLLFGSEVYAANPYSKSDIRWGEQVTYSNLKGNRLRSWVEMVDDFLSDSNLVDANMLWFDNGGYLSNNTDGRIIIGDEGEDLQFVFGTNSIDIRSSTAVTALDFNEIIPKTSYLTVGSVTYTLPSTDGTNGQLLKTNGSAVLSWTAAGAGTVTDLDTAYDGGNTVDVNGSPITLTTSNTDNNRVLDVVQNDTTNNPVAMQITDTGSGGGIQFVCTSGKDVNGTGGTWSVTYAGVSTFASQTLSGAAGLTLSNGATITNGTNNEIKFTENTEDVNLAFLSNQLVLKSSTGVDDIDFGELDDIRGLNRVYFDATSGGLTHTGSAGTAFAISELGNTTAQLNLVSTGTDAQAILIEASQGGIDILASGSIAGEDIDIAATGSSVNVSASENVADSIVLESTAGGIDILASGAASGEDIDIVATGSSVNISATENVAGSINISTTGGGGTTETIVLNNDQGTADNAIDVNATAGGIDLDATKSVTITSVENTIDSVDIISTVGGIEITAVAGAATEDVNILAATSSVQLKGGEADAGAITLNAYNAAGGITMDFGTGNMTITGTGATANFSLDADLGSIDFTGTSNITVTGGAGENFTVAQAGSASAALILSSAGTAASAMQLTTTAGGIDITNGGAAGGEDIDVNSTLASVEIVGSEAVSDAIVLNARDAAGGIDIDCGTGTFDVLVTGGAFSIDGQNAASNVSLVANGAADDLTIGLTGGYDSSIVIDANGTGADAVRIFSRNPGGGIDIDAGDEITVDANHIQFTLTEATQQFGVDCDGTVAGNAIDVNTGDGGILISAGGAANGDVNLVAGDILSLNQVDTTGVRFAGGNASLLFEGVTDDAYETTITITDPTADRTITLPDYTGAVPLVVDQSTTQSTCAGAATDVTGTSIALGANWMDGGETIHYKLFGTKSAANAAMKVYLYLLDGDVLTLTAGDADAGDWTADIYCYSTAGATQDVFGTFMQTANGIIFDHATGAKDMSSGGTIKCRIESQDGADTVTVESVIVEMWVAD